MKSNSFSIRIIDKNEMRLEFHILKIINKYVTYCNSFIFVSYY